MWIILKVNIGRRGKHESEECAFVERRGAERAGCLPRHQMFEAHQHLVPKRGRARRADKKNFLAGEIFRFRKSSIPSVFTPQSALESRRGAWRSFGRGSATHCPLRYL